MNFLKKYNGRIMVIFCIIAVLFTTLFSGCNNTHNITENAVNNQNKSVQPQKSVPAEETTDNSVVYESIYENVEYYKESIDDKEENIEISEENAEPVSESSIISTKQEETETINSQLTCTVSIRCDKAVGKSIEKAAVIPENGIVFAEQTVVFYEGESVFNVLVREMKKHKIHLEFVNIPIYNSAYIEGINNLYEFDCGELSGWMYKVNDRFPNYGCSQYKLKEGDKVEWVYTCDLGKDVGGDYSARNGNVK